MTVFFVRTDRSVAGPFTGVELREATLAGIIGPSAVIGGTPDGPWYRATEIGLFSEKKTPLPHPPDTCVPKYQVRGMPGAFQGPFKLRELIGFAARGMLPADALLQSDQSDEWIAARRFHVLSACLNGDLVLIDGSGKIVLRSRATTPDAEPAPALTARAPIEVAKPVNLRDATAIASSLPKDESEPAENLSAQAPPVSAESEAPDNPSRISLWWANLRLRQRIDVDLRFLLRPRIAVPLVCMLLVFAGVASAYSLWKQISLQRGQVIGDWIAVSTSGDAGDSSFAISLQQDGRCLLFNTKGASWTGDFVWEERYDNQAGFEAIAPFSSVFDEVGPGHELAAVLPTDGYIRLRGFVKEPPMIDGHPVRDLFLRRDGDSLRVGYLAAVHWTQDSKTMEAGWATAKRSPPRHPEIAAEIAANLHAIKREFPVPTEDFGGQQPAHVSDAIVAAQQGVPTKIDNEQVLLHESLAYSTSVNGAYLLRTYGLPDEARQIYPFEVPKLRHGPSFEGAQLVRYGELKFILSDQGELRYLVLAQK